MLRRAATGGYKETKFHSVCKGVRVAHSTVWISKTAYLWEREGAMLSSCFRRRVGREIAKAINSSNVQGLQRKLCQRAKQGCKSRWLKMIGKPCAGKLHARFDLTNDNFFLLNL
jgi:hypothetical protein